MTVLVDTSVWVDFFTGYHSPEAESLARLIEDEAEIVTCGLVVAEFFQGIRDRRSLNTLHTFFLDMPLLQPKEPETYSGAAGLYRELRARSVSVRSTVDCVIARLAEEGGTLLLAKGRDMKQILDSGLCSKRAAPI
jgi:hypothetical protein